tara:strand:- start:1257 stop:3122 length:1866 start_codon:yes stop_codon:yes gene_type:complete
MLDQKIFLVEISQEDIQYKYFPYSSKLWFLRTDNDYSSFSNIDYDLESIGFSTGKNISSVSINQNKYVRVDTIQECADFDQTYYYNDKNLLIHFEDNNTPYDYSSLNIKVGVILGIYNSPLDISGIFRDEQYQPRLKNNPVIKSQKDDLFAQKQRLPNLKIDVENSDLFYKNFNIGRNAKRVNGSLVRLYSYSGEDAKSATIDDFTLDYQGIISKTKEGQQLEIQLKDLRTTLTDKTPSNVLDNSNFSFIKSGTYRKPSLWGEASQIPCICLNEDVNKDIDVLPPSSQTATDYIFMICDTEKRTIASDSIKNIYINNVLSNATALNNVEYDAVNNIAFFTVSEGFFRKAESDDSGNITKISWENQDKLSIDCNGYLDDSSQLITNGMDIISSIINDVYDKPLNSTFYDLTTWNFYRDESYDIAYYLDSPKAVQKQIEEISASLLGKFLYNPDLRFSWDNDDFFEPTIEIDKYKFFGANFLPKFESDPSQVLNKYRVGYSKRWAVSDNELANTWYLDESNEENAVTNYNSFVEKDYPTLLTNLTDAQDFGTRLLFESANSIDTCTIDTLWDYRTLKAGDYVKVQLDYPNEEYMGWTTCQLLEVSPKTNNWSTMLKLRIIRYD